MVAPALRQFGDSGNALRPLSCGGHSLRPPRRTACFRHLFPHRQVFAGFRPHTRNEGAEEESSPSDKAAVSDPGDTRAEGVITFQTGPRRLLLRNNEVILPGDLLAEAGSRLPGRTDRCGTFHCESERVRPTLQIFRSSGRGSRGRPQLGRPGTVTPARRTRRQPKDGLASAPCRWRNVALAVSWSGVGRVVCSRGVVDDMIARMSGPYEFIAVALCRQPILRHRQADTPALVR